MDGVSHRAALTPEVEFVLPLSEHTAAVARPTPAPPLGGGGRRRGAGPREESQEVQNLAAVHGRGRTVLLVDSGDEVEATVVLLLVALS